MGLSGLFKSGPFKPASFEGHNFLAQTLLFFKKYFDKKIIFRSKTLNKQYFFLIDGSNFRVESGEILP